MTKLAGAGRMDGCGLHDWEVIHRRSWQFIFSRKTTGFLRTFTKKKQSNEAGFPPFIYIISYIPSIILNYNYIPIYYIILHYIILYIIYYIIFYIIYYILYYMLYYIISPQCAEINPCIKLPDICTAPTVRMLRVPATTRRQCHGGKWWQATGRSFIEPWPDGLEIN